MVVYLHSYNLTTTLLDITTDIKSFDLNSFIQIITNDITKIAVPLFFSIAGYLFFLNFNPTLNNFLIKYKKRFFSLLVPFLFWSTIGVLLYYLLQSSAFPKEIISKDLVEEYTINKMVTTIFLNPIPYQLWFIIDLMKFVLISPLIYLYVSKFSYFSLFPFITFWFLDINILFSRNDGMLFFIFGSLLAIKALNTDMVKLECKKFRKLFPLLWILILFVMTYLKLKDFSDINYLYKISIIIGLLTIWFNYDSIIKKKWVEDTLLYLSSYTFFIYLFHEPMLSIINRSVLRFAGISSYINLIVYLTVPVFTIILAIVIARLLEKHTYWFYKIITGNRSNNIK